MPLLWVAKVPGTHQGEAKLNCPQQVSAESRERGRARPEWSGTEGGRKLCRVTGLGLDRHKASTQRSFAIKPAEPGQETPLKHYKRQLSRGKEGAGAAPGSRSLRAGAAGGVPDPIREA